VTEKCQILVTFQLLYVLSSDKAAGTVVPSMKRFFMRQELGAYAASVTDQPETFFTRRPFNSLPRFTVGRASMQVYTRSAKSLALNPVGLAQ
jgi:hypothetical protein